jgi:mannose-6-phosphate isomerase
MSEYRTKPVPDDAPEVALVTRPWGAFKQYAHNAEVTVSLMTVQPGERLSLQAHNARAELWIVLDEGARVQVGDEVHDPAPGDEIWIPANTKHRLSSIGDKPTRVLEVAFGNWQQSDIVRFDDDYARLGKDE